LAAQWLRGGVRHHRVLGFFVGHLPGVAALHFIVKTFEKIFCHGFGSPVDEPLAELRDLAAHLVACTV
jgi:hypothetical protein